MGGCHFNESKGQEEEKDDAKNIKNGRWNRIGENNLQAGYNEQNGKKSIDMLKHWRERKG